MVNKIKVFVGFLALIALFSVFTLIDSFRSSSPVVKTANILKGTLSFEVDPDTDKDGLSNREESYWNTDFQNPDTDGDGFLDGEEVASGHDPLKPGPDDLLINNNVTKQLSNLTLGGLVEGSLKSSSPNYTNSLNMVVDEIFRQSEINSSLKLSSPQIVENTPENIKKYTSDIFPYLESSTIRDLDRFIELTDLMGDVDLSNISTLTGNPELRQKSVNYIEQEIIQINSQIENLQKMSVPKKFTDHHMKLAIFFESIKKNYILLNRVEDDPVQSLIAFNALVNLYINRLPEIVADFATSITNSLSTQ
ncbi:MAG: hypothetical protein HYT67_01200 [Candidatus Yanofskybacteria bacterium]|nr:hypothetical protein [Candidatus Yanofskybacteria bacterium]